ncbi:hypothetical protein MTO96_017460 [Rhipicephalus appendiculatus]
MSYGYPQAQHQYQPPPAPGFAPPQQMPPPRLPRLSATAAGACSGALLRSIGASRRHVPTTTGTQSPQHLYPMQQQQPGSYYVPPAPPATVIVKEKEDSCAKDCCLCALCMGLCCLCCQD